MIEIHTENIEKNLQKILGRTEYNLDRPEVKIVARIIKDVRRHGDKAVLKYTRRFDRVKLNNLRVDALELELAHAQIDKELLKALRVAIKNIAEYHFRQAPRSWQMKTGSSSSLGLRYSPVLSAGVYVPGGRAFYLSTVLMNVIPAKIAGVQRIVIVTPPGKDGAANPMLLAAARELGVDEIYLCGGAQSIAALAYGTQTIPKVDMIVGPGNIYMTLAKKLLYGTVGFDKLAGPSDCLILADKTADPKYIAADMLAQAEHDPLASALLITDSLDIARKTAREIEKQIIGLERSAVIRQSLRAYGGIFVIKNKNDFLRLTDLIAPEHLEIMLKNADKIADEVNNAGAIFIGAQSPVALGDYIAGPNHVLPTGGTARFASPLSVEDFIKKTSLVQYAKSDLKAMRGYINTLAGTEGFTAHAASVNIRFKAKS